MPDLDRRGTETPNIGSIDHEEDAGTASIHPSEVGSARINIFLNDNGPFFDGYTQYEDILFLRQTHTPEEVNDIRNGVALLHELGETHDVSKDGKIMNAPSNS